MINLTQVEIRSRIVCRWFVIVLPPRKPALLVNYNDGDGRLKAELWLQVRRHMLLLPMGYKAGL